MKYLRPFHFNYAAFIWLSSTPAAEWLEHCFQFLKLDLIPLPLPFQFSHVYSITHCLSDSHHSLPFVCFITQAGCNCLNPQFLLSLLHEHLHSFSPSTSSHNCSFSSFHSCVRPPATGHPAGPNQSDGSCRRHSGPQLCGIRKPHPHHPVEEGWCFGVHTWLQGQTAGHGRFADTLCKGKAPAHMYKHAQISF